MSVVIQPSWLLNPIKVILLFGSLDSELVLSVVEPTFCIVATVVRVELPS